MFDQDQAQQASLLLFVSSTVLLDAAMNQIIFKAV